MAKKLPTRMMEVNEEEAKIVEDRRSMWKKLQTPEKQALGTTLQKVQTVLVDSLGIDEEEAQPTALVHQELGAESIDYLDIMFRLEKVFGIKIPRGELWPEEIINNPEYVVGGRLTPTGVTLLKQRFPNLDLSELDKNPAVGNFDLTVQCIVEYIDEQLKKQKRA